MHVWKSFEIQETANVFNSYRKQALHPSSEQGEIIKRILEDKVRLGVSIVQANKLHLCFVSDSAEGTWEAGQQNWEAMTWVL